MVPLLSQYRTVYDKLDSVGKTAGPSKEFRTSAWPQERAVRDGDQFCVLECLIAGDTCRFVENRQNRYFVQVAMQLALAVAVAGFINEPVVQQAKIQQKRVLWQKGLKLCIAVNSPAPILTLPHIKHPCAMKISCKNEYFVGILILWPGQIKIKFDKSRLFAWNSSKNHLYDLLFRFRTPLLPLVCDQHYLC